MKVKLIDICDFQGGSQPPKDEWKGNYINGYIRMLQIRDFTQKNKVIPEYVKISNSLKFCEADDILIARYGASVGKILTGLSGAYNVAIMKIIPDTTRLNKRYLKYFLESRSFQDFIKNVGSRAAQAGFNKSDLSSIFIEERNINEQNKIINILDKLTSLIELKKNQLEKMNLFVKSLFIEMFGSQLENPYNFEKGIIKDVVSDVKYGTSSPANDNGIYPYLRMGNITYDGQLDLTNLKYITIDDKELDKYIVKKGDILFNRTNSKELVGKTCVFNLDEPMIIAGYIIRVRTNNRVIPEYLSAVLNSKYGKQTLFDMCKSIVGQANINAQELQKIKLLVPPIEIQLKYKSYLVQIDKSKYASGYVKLIFIQNKILNIFFS